MTLKKRINTDLERNNLFFRPANKISEHQLNQRHQRSNGNLHFFSKFIK